MRAMQAKPDLCVEYLRQTISDCGLKFEVQRQLLAGFCGLTAIPVPACLKMLKECSLGVPQAVYQGLVDRAESDQAWPTFEAMLGLYSNDVQVWLDYIYRLKASDRHKEAKRVHQRALQIVSDKTALLQ